MMQDLISRQDAIDALNEYFARIGKLKRRGLTKGEKAISLDTVGVIKTMPSAQPERTGKWINGHWDGDSNFRIDGRGNCWFVRECSNCHEEIKGKPTNYCPNCGCRMKEGEGHD